MVAPKKKKAPFTQSQLNVMSAVAQRAAIASRLGKSYSGDRDLYGALGYSKTPSYEDYLARYARQDVARAVVDVPVNASWRIPPRVTGGDAFDEQWNALVKERSIYRQFVRVDKMAGIGNYAVLLMGFDDSLELSQPVTKASALLFLQPYTQKSAVIKTHVLDPKDERYGLPENYTIILQAGGSAALPKEVHHSRIIHIAENLLEDNVLGMPRLQPVLNRLEDLERIVGGSAEMFWRGAFQGLALKADEGHSMTPQDLDAIQDEMEEYLHDLKRYVRTRGMSIETIGQQVADPSNHATVILDLISAATGIPKRILLGSERGELASSQDEKNWLQKISSRQNNFCEPSILRALVDTLIEVSVLPEPKEGYAVEWPDLMALSDKEIAENGALQSKALKDYLDSDAHEIIPPELFMRRVMGWTEDDIEEAIKFIGKISKITNDEDEDDDE